ncbi:MAG: 3'-5' exonuclease [Clostridiales bacterium]|nr:3'-5' exonuclease [Clostridiales bacterium]
MILYLDTETTALAPGQICQLSYVIQNGEIFTAKNFYFTVDDMDYNAYMVHGLSKERLQKLSGGKRFSDYIDEIANDFESAEYIFAHNLSFDLSFLRAEFSRLDKTLYVKNEFCSMKRCTPLCKLPRKSGEGYKYPKLSELCEFFGITDEDIKSLGRSLFGEIKGAHDSRFDTVALVAIANKGKGLSVFETIQEYL